MLLSVTPYHPSNFSPIINHVSGIAARNNDGKSYQILLIITKGSISGGNRNGDKSNSFYHIS